MSKRNKRFDSAKKLFWVAPVLMCASLSSCFQEQPQSFENLVIYQGAYKFSFGGWRGWFFHSVPNGKGERISIDNIIDTFYTSRGFLLYICTLINQPNDYYLCKYDYAKGESQLLTTVSSFPNDGVPHFYAANDYSPRFVVKDARGNPTYAFFDKDEQIVLLPDGLSIFWAGEEGYATTTRFGNDVQAEEENVFHYYDGTDVAIDGKISLLSVGSTGLLFEKNDGTLCRWDKATETYADCGEYKVIYSDRTVPKDIESVGRYVGNWKQYRYRLDLAEGKLFLVRIDNGILGEEKAFSFPLGGMNDLRDIKIIGQSNDIYLFTGSNASYLIDISSNEIIQLSDKGFATFEHTLYSGEKYDILEQYYPMNGGFLYVLDKKAQTKIRVKDYGSSFFYQRIEEKD